MNGIKKKEMMSCTLYVGGVVKGDRDIVRKAFQGFGAIRQVDYLESKACAFVKFGDVECARAAMEEMQGARVAGQIVRCRWAKERSASPEEKKTYHPMQRSCTPSSPPLKLQKMNTPEQKKNTEDQRINTLGQRMNTPNQKINSPIQKRNTPDQRRKMNNPDERINTSDERMNTPNHSTKIPDQNVNPLVERMNTPDKRMSPLIQNMTTPITAEKNTLVQQTNTPVKNIHTPNQMMNSPLQENRQNNFKTPDQSSLRHQSRQSPHTPFSARKIKTNKENFANGTWLQVPDCKSLPLPPTRWIQTSPEAQKSPASSKSTNSSTPTTSITSSNQTIKAASSTPTS